MQQRILALQQRLLALARAVWTAMLLLLAALRIRRAEDEPPADTPTSPAAPPTTLASADAPASPALASADAPLHPLALTADEFAAAASARLGRGGVLARALYRDYHRDGTLSAVRARELQQAPALAAQLCALCAGAPPLALTDGAAAPAPGATEKYVLRTHDGYEVEMVAMPAPGAAGEWSLCVSSQVGCRQGCAFCETGRLGLLRDLSAAEIASQVAHARHSLGLRVRSVVYMGMGEPLDNVVEVIQSIRVLTESSGLGVAMSQVTVSTAGEARHVYSLVGALPRVRMAFSIHFADDATRSRLMPINRRFSLDEFGRAISHYIETTKRRATVQYTLLAGENDALADADALAALLRDIAPAERLHVNLIPYNWQSEPRRFETPTEAACKAFKERLVKEHGYFVKLRETRGADKMAACGQLGNVALRKRGGGGGARRPPLADVAPGVDLSW